MSATKISKNTASVLNCYIFNCILNILNSKRLHPATLLKGDSGTGVFLWAFWIFLGRTIASEKGTVKMTMAWMRFN